MAHAIPVMKQAGLASNLCNDLFINNVVPTRNEVVELLSTYICKYYNHPDNDLNLVKPHHSSWTIYYLWIELTKQYS